MSSCKVVFDGKFWRIIDMAEEERKELEFKRKELEFIEEMIIAREARKAEEKRKELYIRELIVKKLKDSLRGARASLNSLTITHPTDRFLQYQTRRIRDRYLNKLELALWRDLPNHYLMFCIEHNLPVLRNLRQGICYPGKFRNHKKKAMKIYRHSYNEYRKIEFKEFYQNLKNFFSNDIAYLITTFCI